MKLKVLFVTQEITPYLPETEMSLIGRHLPQGIQERNREIRTFLPKFGNINERRNQLHEVIRLSGMNLVIDDTDHPLIIKVASIQAARMQVYFIDNEDYFQRKHVFHDKHKKFYEDNDERAIFFCKGVIETVKKLGWAPDIVHCNDWMTSLIPMYLKTTYKNEPLFKNTKSVFAVYNNGFSHTFGDDLLNKVKMVDIDDAILAPLMSKDYTGFIKMGMEYADLIVKGGEVSAELNQLIEGFSKDRKFEINIESEGEEQAHEELYEIYTNLAG
jgi:starch synthase